MLGVPTELCAKILPFHTDRNCKPGFCFFLRILSHDLFMLRTYTFIDVDRRPEIETEVTGAELYRRVFSKTLFFFHLCTSCGITFLSMGFWSTGTRWHICMSYAALVSPTTSPCVFRISVRSSSGWAGALLASQFPFLERCAVCINMVMNKETWVVSKPHSEWALVFWTRNYFYFVLTAPIFNLMSS